MDKEFFESLGRFTVAFSELEATVYHATLALSGNNVFKSMVLVDRLSFDNRLKVLAELGRLNIPGIELPEQLRKITREIGQVAQRRNQILHSYHAPSRESTDRVKRLKQDLGSKGMRFQEEDYTSVDIMRDHDRTWSLNYRLIDFMIAIIDQDILEDLNDSSRTAFAVWKERRDDPILGDDSSA